MEKLVRGFLKFRTEVLEIRKRYSHDYPKVRLLVPFLLPAQTHESILHC